MRAFFLALVAFGICACGMGSYPYMNLRHPIYLVTDKSFWSGCEKDPAGEEVCRSLRVSKVNQGLRQWFDYFGESDYPRTVIVHSRKSLPDGVINDPLYLRIEAGNCGINKAGKQNVACYNSSTFLPHEIVFDTSLSIEPRTIAHEFGHALGRDDNDVPEYTDSVMSYTNPTTVTRLDVEMMCGLHHECRMEKKKCRK